MQIIKKFKSKFLKLGSDEDPLTFLIGLRFFQVGVLFLASAPIIAFLLLIFSSLITSFIKGGNYFRWSQ